MPEPLEPPLAERAIGLGFYASRTPGVPGRLKSSPDAFRVTELSSYPLPDPDGAFVVLRISSRDWEQHELGAAIARRLGRPAGTLSWAGTKDRRAVAERLVSYRGSLPTGPLDLPRVDVLEAYRARDGLVLGHHYGNVFDVRIDALLRPAPEAVGIFGQIAEELRAGGGVPNFFGPQRFGEVRPITHEVGRWVVRGDLARAVDAYLIDRPVAGRPGLGDDAREAYGAHRDPVRALREFPAEYRFERALLERLARGQPPVRALGALSRDLRLLFVHAFQSYLFNRWLSARAAAGVPLDRPVDGDEILRLGRDGTVRSREAVPVDADNRTECADLVARGRALVAGPLVGFDTVVRPGTPGALLRELLQAEGVEPSDFRAPSTPEISSRGAARPLLVPFPPLGLVPEGPEAVRFRFALPKGSYATVLLREFLKGPTAGAPPPPLSKGAY